jgi:hypothetical protein
MSVRFLLIGATAVISAWCWCGPAAAQVDDTPVAPISPTSPLGIDSTPPVGGTGIRLGATEIPSAGVSPLPTFSTGTVALPGSGTTCTTLVTSPSGLIGSTDTYDGGGMTMGSATAATAATAGPAAMSGATATTGMSAPSTTSTASGMPPIFGMSTASTLVGVSGLCGFSSGNMATSPTTPTSTVPTTPGGIPRTGIPLDSTEIANLGVSSAAAIPTPSVSLGPIGTTTMPAISNVVPTPAVPATPSTTFIGTACVTLGTSSGTGSAATSGAMSRSSPGCQSTSGL